MVIMRFGHFGPAIDRVFGKAFIHIKLPFHFSTFLI